MVRNFMNKDSMFKDTDERNAIIVEWNVIIEQNKRLTLGLGSKKTIQRNVSQGHPHQFLMFLLRPISISHLLLSAVQLNGAAYEYDS